MDKDKTLLRYKLSNQEKWFTIPQYNDKYQNYNRTYYNPVYGSVPQCETMSHTFTDINGFEIRFVEIFTRTGEIYTTYYEYLNTSNKNTNITLDFLNTDIFLYAVFTPNSNIEKLKIINVKNSFDYLFLNNNLLKRFNVNGIKVRKRLKTDNITLLGINKENNLELKINC